MQFMYNLQDIKPKVINNAKRKFFKRLKNVRVIIIYTLNLTLLDFFNSLLYIYIIQRYAIIYTLLLYSRSILLYMHKCLFSI